MQGQRHSRACLVFASALALPMVQVQAAPQSSDCQPSWQPTFGAAPDVHGPVLAFTQYDDGSGATLFAGGQFTSAGGLTANGIVKWNRTGWSELDGGVGGVADPAVT